MLCVPDMLQGEDAGSVRWLACALHETGRKNFSPHSRCPTRPQWRAETSRATLDRDELLCQVQQLQVGGVSLLEAFEQRRRLQAAMAAFCACFCFMWIDASRGPWADSDCGLPLVPTEPAERGQARRPAGGARPGVCGSGAGHGKVRMTCKGACWEQQGSRYDTGQRSSLEKVSRSLAARAPVGHRRHHPPRSPHSHAAQD